jgi:hypothetical protein
MPDVATVALVNNKHQVIPSVGAMMQSAVLKQNTGPYESQMATSTFFSQVPWTFEICLMILELSVQRPIFHGPPSKEEYSC